MTTGSCTTAEVAARAGISRQAAHGHLRSLAEAGRLVARGKGRATRYFALEHGVARTVPLAGADEVVDETTDEATVWNDVWAQAAAANPELARPSAGNARAILNYAFTEMLNNAIDHSGSRQADVELRVVRGVATFTVSDDGVGVFESVRARLSLDDARAALQEISKGKTTTQPERHSGQGLFFTSKVADLFRLEANGVAWIVDNRRGDVAVAVTDAASRPGTVVRFEVALDTTRTLADIFARYSQDDFQFDTSRVVVKLFEHGDTFVSRSEAKRVVRGLERFRHVIFDFRGVEMVGQSFADEIFRVWAAEHPEVTLEPLAMNGAVRFMVERSRRDPARPRLGEAPPGPWPGGAPDPLAGPDAVDLEDAQVEAVQIIDGLVVATRRDARHARWTSCRIVVTSRASHASLAVLELARRAGDDPNLWSRPVAALATALARRDRERVAREEPASTSRAPEA